LHNTTRTAHKLTCRVITSQVLELSPASFMPDLSIYFGIVLSLESSPHSTTIRLKLHPDCRPFEDDDMDIDNGEDEPEEPRLPKYFGEDLEKPENGTGQPDIREIKLDDIVDCRRVVLK
jgi:hypothetical protein